MAQNLDERQLASNRTLITINEKKSKIDKNLKAGTLNYVMLTEDDKKSDQLLMTIPETRNQGIFVRVPFVNEDGGFTGSYNFDDLTINNDLLVKGNMVVKGTIASTHRIDLKVKDNFIVINELGIDPSGSGIADGIAGIQIDRGDDLTEDAYIRFRESFKSLVSNTDIKGFDFAKGSDVLLSLSTDKKLEVPTIETNDSIFKTSKITTANITTLNNQLINKDLAFKDHIHYVSQNTKPTPEKTYNGLIWHDTNTDKDYLVLDNKYKEIPTNSNGPTLNIIPFNTIITKDGDKKIQISGYNATKDELLVYYNEKFIQKGIDYSINTDDNTITLINIESKINDKANGLIYKNVKIYTPSLVEEPKVKRVAKTFDDAGLIIKNEYYRIDDNTLYRTVEASNPNDKGRYQTITEKVFTQDGALERTIKYTLTYNDEGLCISNDGGILL